MGALQLDGHAPNSVANLQLHLQALNGNKNIIWQSSKLDAVAIINYEIPPIPMKKIGNLQVLLQLVAIKNY